MKWEEYVEIKKNENANFGWEETDIECPKCGNYIHKNTFVHMMSFPLKDCFRCFNCEWEGIV